jgi:DNA repair exonuclease SbcCD ATPase subunit
LNNGSFKLRLPSLESARLSNFSLYSQEPVIDVGFGDGAFCLAGANGLGKSTFLSLLNFALTGAVPIPHRPFRSVDDYYKLSVNYAQQFFEGRVSESDREICEINLSFRTNGTQFSITRGVFDSESIRSLTISPLESDPKLNQLSSQDLNDLYKLQLTKLVGLESFAQYVFIQHFVLTFDEGRHLLFWDQKALQQVLHLTFGVDAKTAKRADSIRHDADRADSRARNFNWQGTELRTKLETVQEAVKLERNTQFKAQDLREAHKKLLEHKETAEEKIQKIASSISDAELAIATASARHVTLRGDYDKEYSRHIRNKTNLSRNPLVVDILEEKQCGLCGNRGNQLSRVVRRKVEQDLCPLCETSLDSSDTSASARLRDLDKELMKVRRELDEGIKKRDRLSNSMEEIKSELEKASQELTDFEKTNATVLKRLLASETTGVDTALTTYREQIRDLDKRKKEEYARRDELRRELRIIEKDLVKQYAAAENEFAPRFQKLAFLFLGLELDVRVETKTASGITLILAVRNTERREIYQLSESQRFFIDIALRMAILAFLSVEHGGALFVDTPEGSLDIAYENRAGTMFADFVKQGFMLILTANINTSRLLLALAEQCGSSKMTLCRMTAWTELSEVQVAEEKLFEAAYATIQNALGTGTRAIEGDRNG